MNSKEDFINELEHPEWVYRELFEDYLPWEQGRRINFVEFNKKYTLHDSYWIGIFFNVAYYQTATLAIQWDAVWLPDEVAISVYCRFKFETIVAIYPRRELGTLSCRSIE